MKYQHNFNPMILDEEKEQADAIIDVVSKIEVERGKIILKEKLESYE